MGFSVLENSRMKQHYLKKEEADADGVLLVSMKVHC